MEIRTLIEDWASAVHGGDLDCVLADHDRRRLRPGAAALRQDGRWTVAHEHHSFPG